MTFHDYIISEYTSRVSTQSERPTSCDRGSSYGRNRRSCSKRHATREFVALGRQGAPWQQPEMLTDVDSKSCLSQKASQYWNPYCNPHDVNRFASQLFTIGFLALGKHYHPELGVPMLLAAAVPGFKQIAGRLEGAARVGQPSVQALRYQVMYSQ